MSLFIYFLLSIGKQICSYDALDGKNPITAVTTMPAPHCSVVFGSADSVLRFIDPRKPGLQVSLWFSKLSYSKQLLYFIPAILKSVAFLIHLYSTMKNVSNKPFLVSPAWIPSVVQQCKCRAHPLPGSESVRTRGSCRFLVWLYCDAGCPYWTCTEGLACTWGGYPSNEGILCLLLFYIEIYY